MTEAIKIALLGIIVGVAFGMVMNFNTYFNTFGHVVHFCENGYMMAESYHGLSYDIKDGHFVECGK